MKRTSRLDDWQVWLCFASAAWFAALGTFHQEDTGSDWALLSRGCSFWLFAVCLHEWRWRARLRAWLKDLSLEAEMAVMLAGGLSLLVMELWLFLGDPLALTALLVPFTLGILRQWKVTAARYRARPAPRPRPMLLGSPVEGPELSPAVAREVAM